METIHTDDAPRHTGPVGRKGENARYMLEVTAYHG